jgi:hypothetical protein
MPHSCKRPVGPRSTTATGDPLHHLTGEVGDQGGSPPSVPESPRISRSERLCSRRARPPWSPGIPGPTGSWPDQSALVSATRAYRFALPELRRGSLLPDRQRVPYETQSFAPSLGDDHDYDRVEFPTSAQHAILPRWPGRTLTLRQRTRRPAQRRQVWCRSCHTGYVSDHGNSVRDRGGS